MPDDATWLPEGAFVVLGACGEPDCDRVGWAFPTYRDIRIVVSEDCPPNHMYVVNVKQRAIPVPQQVSRVDSWCPVHGTRVVNVDQVDVLVPDVLVGGVPGFRYR